MCLIWIEVTCCLFFFIAARAWQEPRGTSSDFFIVLRSDPSATHSWFSKHMHLDAMKKWYKLSKSLAIWFPCLQSIIMESLDIQKWEIKRLIKKDFSQGTLSHMSEFFFFLHRETFSAGLFNTGYAWLLSHFYSYCTLLHSVNFSWFFCFSSKFSNYRTRSINNRSHQ